MSARLLCGIAIDVRDDTQEGTFFDRLPTCAERAVLSVGLEAVLTPRRAAGALLFSSPDFEVREAADAVEISIYDSGLPAAWCRLRPGRDAELALRRDLPLASQSLRDELLPELLVAHLWPFFGLTYVHAAATLSAAGARLFMGPSGRGKSTVAALLSEAGDPLVCADRCALGSHPAWIAGAPWHGGQPGAGERFPLSEIHVLTRGGAPRCERLSPAQAALALAANAFLPRWWPRGLEAGLDALVSLAKHVPIYELCSEPDHRLVRRVREAA